MGKSYGFIEISGVVAAMDALDHMCKAADVELATWERKLGGRLVTIVVEGTVSAVTEAVEVATQRAIKKPVAHGVIANPHEEIVRLIQLSRSRFAPDNEEEEQQTEEKGINQETVELISNSSEETTNPVDSTDGNQEDRKNTESSSSQSNKEETQIKPKKTSQRKRQSKEVTPVEDTSFEEY